MNTNNNPIIPTFFNPQRKQAPYASQGALNPIDRVCLQMMIKNTSSSGLVSIALALILTFYMSGWQPTPDMLLWPCCIAFVVGCREGVFYRRFREQLENGRWQFEPVHRVIVVSLVMAGLLWGYGVWQFMPQAHNHEGMAVLITVIVGITAGNVSSFSYSKTGFLAFMWPLMIITVLAMLNEGFYTLAALAAVYALHLVVLVKRLNRVNLSAISADVQSTTPQVVYPCQSSETVAPVQQSALCDEPQEAPAEKDRQFIDAIKDYVEQHFSDPQLGAKAISEHLAISERQLSRKSRDLLDQSVPDFIRGCRLREGAKMLQEGKQVTETALSVGFSSQAYFSKCFKASYGQSPSQYRLRNQEVCC